MFISGDVHPHPGPLSTTSSNSISSSSSSLSSTVFNCINLIHLLSFVHYNIQSIASKLDILHAELFEFDILAFTETWLSSSLATDDLVLDSCSKPERKDRVGDAHGGVMIYVKEYIHYRRRRDLEPRGIECIWIEIANNTKHALFGVFYRPPNSDSTYYTSIEDSLHLATDTGIKDIIITSDFNFYLLHQQTIRKIDSLCNQFALFQAINQPTHYTEHSSSLLDILLVSNKEHLILSGVGDPFLAQNLRYRCPIYGIFKFSTAKLKSYTRLIWYYEQGNYDLLRSKVAAVDWDSLHDQDIDTYAQNITTHIISLAKDCIPNKTIRIRPSDPPWLTSYLKQYIRKRKRAYRRAKRTNLASHWDKFRRLRNKAISVLRDSKKTFYDKISDKLKSESLCSKDLWSTLKSIINQNTKSQIPPLESNGLIYTDEKEKANLLNQFFQSQTVLDEQNVSLPELTCVANSRLSSIVLTPNEVQLVLKSLPTDKASGPNGINNRIL